MTAYRPLSAFTPGSVSTGDSTQYVFGLSFKVTQPGCQLDGWWWWCDIAGGQASAAEDFALWQTTGAGTGTYVASSKVTSGTFVQGWNFIPCATPIPLTVGQEYRAVKSTNKGLAGGSNYTVSGLFFDTGSGSAGVVSGPVTVFAKPGAATNPEPAGDGQMVFATATDVTANYPSTQFNQTWYGMDIQVSVPSGAPMTQQKAGRTRLRTRAQRLLPTPPVAANVNVNGAVANVSVAAPTGTESVSVSGAVANVTVVAPVGTASTAVSGTVAGVSVAAPVGTESVSVTTGPASVSVAALAGTESVSTTSPAANVSVAGLLGTESTSITGQAAAFAVAAPMGAVISSVNGTVASVTVIALVGAEAVGVAGVPGLVSVAAPQGQARATSGQGKLNLIMQSMF